MDETERTRRRRRPRGVRTGARSRRSVPRLRLAAVVTTLAVTATSGCGDLRSRGGTVSETAEAPGGTEPAEAPGTASEAAATGAADTAGARTASESTGAWSGAVRRKVLAMRDADQEVRSELAARMREGAEADSAEMRRLAVRQDSVDRANTERLREIIRAHGWPGVERAGREAANAAFLLVQHATHDLDFQKEYLAFLEEEHRAGRAPGEAVALLTDRTRQAEGKLQLYGTQMSIRDGEVVMDPIQDEEDVDRRRAALGLVPLDEYIAQVKEAYGLPD